jgi:hypothetical protein
MRNIDDPTYPARLAEALLPFFGWVIVILFVVGVVGAIGEYIDKQEKSKKPPSSSTP